MYNGNGCRLVEQRLCVGRFLFPSELFSFIKFILPVIFKLDFSQWHSSNIQYMNNCRWSKTELCRERNIGRDRKHSKSFKDIEAAVLWVTEVNYEFVPAVVSLHSSPISERNCFVQTETVKAQIIIGQRAGETAHVFMVGEVVCMCVGV